MFHHVTGRMKPTRRVIQVLLVVVPSMGTCIIVGVLVGLWLSSRPYYYKYASSRDSYSRWSMYVVDRADAQEIIDEHHREMAFVDDDLLSTMVVEQDSRPIYSIVVRSPTIETPTWWQPPSCFGRATENMLWYKNADYGVAHGCYTVYDNANCQLWIYEYAAQHDSLWSRGTRPK